MKKTIVYISIFLIVSGIVGMGAAHYNPGATDGTCYLSGMFFTTIIGLFLVLVIGFIREVSKWFKG